MEIENYREQPAGGSVVAIFDIAWPAQFGLTFRNWKLIRSKKGNLFITGPSYSEVQHNGDKKWLPFIDFNKEKKESFEKKVLEALGPFLEQSLPEGHYLEPPATSFF
jgi:hypothetical protein